MRIFAAILLSFVTLLLWEPLTVRAFTISPARYLVTVDPGGQQKISLTVKNDEAENLVFKFSVTGMVVDSAGRPRFGNGIDEAENWVKPEVGTLLIVSGGQKKINFIIRVPSGASPGAHYVGLTVQPEEPLGGQENLIGRLISLVNLQVAGEVNENLEIIRWRGKKSLTGQERWDFDLEFKNNGTIEVPLSGTVTVKNWRGQDLFSIPLTMGNPLLAHATRSLTPSIEAGQRLNFPGFYSVQAQITYGKTKQVVSATTTLWYFPRQILITSGLILLVLTTLIIWRKKIRSKFYSI